MSVIVIIGIAIGLAMDAFAAAVAVGVILGDVSKRQVFRLSFHFGLFQAMMPVLGWLAGNSVSHAVQAWDHWVAFGLLAFVGGRSMRASLRAQEQENEDVKGDPTRGLSLVMLSTATSIDAFAVGLSFAMLNVKIWRPSAVIGIVAAVLTLIGIVLGSRLGLRFGKRMELLGGLILVGIGLGILVQHLLSGYCLDSVCGLYR